MIELKPLSRDALPAALERAEHYRLLNEPGQAESICLDVLEVEPDNQRALVTLLLALTDQFRRGTAGAVQRAHEIVPRLDGDYRRAYYAGIICEREAKAALRRGGPRAPHMAYQGLRRAMEHYERAEAIRPAGNDDAVLRYNTCARIINADPRIAPEEPVPQTRPQMLE